MLKPQLGLVFAVPLLVRGRFLTCAVAAGTCFLLSLVPALMCKVSPLTLILQTPAANAFCFHGCGTYPFLFCGLALEVLVVDDCSTDASLAVAEGLAKEYPELSVIRHEVNRGKGAALRTGFLRATGDYVGVQDADLEYSPRDYLEMIRVADEFHADVVFGSRYLRKSERQVLRFWHSSMNRFLTFLSNAFTDLELTDMETCYKMFRREVIGVLAPQLRENRFGFEPEVVARLAKAMRKRGWFVAECAVSYRPRTFSEGKKIGWKDGMRALWCVLRYNLFA